ncbi:hypothetical protein KDL30_02145 [bacterium]|nr:hypothetical protein [bacterium]
MNRLLIAILALLLLGLAACRDNKPSSGSDTQATDTPAAGEVSSVVNESELDMMPYGPRGLSAIDFKGLYKRAPLALDVGRAGQFAFYKLLLEDGEHAIYSASLAGSGKPEPRELAHGSKYNIAYIAAHPSQQECLVTTNYMAEDGHVHNKVWRVGPDMLMEVPYESCPGVPAQHNESKLQDLRPFYSWDGKQVIVPLSDLGVVDADIESGNMEFVALPDPKILVAAWQYGPLPPSGLGNLLYCSVWETGTRDEKCRLFTLDLEKLDTFQLQLDVTWIVYRFTSPDLEFEPWVLHGSRLPDYLEAKRQPRMSLYDRDSGNVEDIELGGDAEFNIRLNPLGTKVAFMDRNRQALVLLDLGTEDSSADDRWFSPEAELFVTDEDSCYLWHRDIFMKCFE